MDKKALSTFKKKKILTVPELQELLDCSITTVRRRLKEWNVHTSYNKCGAYYTLPIVPNFGENGIWQHKEALFSSYGNLRQTVIGVVEHSVAGLDAFEMSELVKLPAHTFLSHLKLEPELQREKDQGLYIYYSGKSKRYKEQRDQRAKRHYRDSKLELPSDGDAVIILVELIRHPAHTALQLSRRARRKRLKVSTQQIRNLLSYHDLLKKTVDTERFKA